MGWNVCGIIPHNSPANKSVANLSLDKLDEQVRPFWQIEEFTDSKLLTKEETFCENYFESTFTRNPEGRFVIRRPVKKNYNYLGEPRDTACQRFKVLERKLNKNGEFKEAYKDFIKEYQLLGHMTKVELSLDEAATYLPHHGLIKESSSTTKLRVVFNASSKTTSGVLLNHVQCIGSTLQSDLFTFLLNFRTSAYIITGDIEKMYRQILVRPQDRKFQRTDPPVEIHST